MIMNPRTLRPVVVVGLTLIATFVALSSATTSAGHPHRRSHSGGYYGSSRTSSAPSNPYSYNPYSYNPYYYNPNLPYWQQPGYQSGSSGYSTPSRDRYGAIAYSRSTGKYGYSYGHSSRAAAEQDALNRCNAQDHEVIGWMKNAYGVLAVGDDVSHYGWGWSSNRATAQQNALKYCRQRTTNSHVAVTVFSGN